MAFPVKNRLMTFKVETTVGTDATPTVGSNAVRTIEAGSGINLETLAIDEETGSLDNNVQAPNGGFMSPTVQAVLRGSGTAGTAPDFGSLLQACAFAETVIGTEETGTAQAGSASTITLASGDVTADNEFVGAIIELTAGTGYSASNAKQNRRLITASVASTDVVTVYPDWAVTPSTDTTYAIRQCVIYRPTSTSVKSGTGYFYKRSDSGDDAILEKGLGIRGSMSLNLPVRASGTLSFDMRGALQEPGDVTDPGAPTLQTSKPIAWIDAQTYLGGDSVCMNLFTLDYGGQVVVRECQNEVYGYRDAAIVSRRIAGTINPDAANIADRNVFASWAAQTGVKFWTTYGPTAGNRVSIYIPELVYGGASDQDINGFLNTNIPWLAGGKDGNTLIITFW